MKPDGIEGKFSGVVRPDAESPGTNERKITLAEIEALRPALFPRLMARLLVRLGINFGWSLSIHLRDVEYRALRELIEDWERLGYQVQMAEPDGCSESESTR